MVLISVFLLIILIFIVLGYIYLYTLSIASLFSPAFEKSSDRPLKFAVAIPAHNEEGVISRTVEKIHNAAYPHDNLDVYVVADFCTDCTALFARQAGATVYERSTGERGGKGEALSWLFRRIFETGEAYEAVAVFDADTQVSSDFFAVMSLRLAAGAQVVQGNHIIRNPHAGWFPALTWAMFMVDNRYQNLGRSNLGLSAKHMGDSICFTAGILRWFGWGIGLTEDYSFRHKLLLHGVCIEYEPCAKGYGDAALTWREAQSQRARWLLGAHQSNRSNARNLLLEGIKRRDPALLDAAFQAYLPPYSPLTLMTGIFMFFAWLLSPLIWSWLPIAFTFLFGVAFLFPFLNLALDRAPIRAYLSILTGPVFILWRTWLSLKTRFFNQKLTWVRTPRHVQH